uniref:Uncharacterized protein n=1 Tax=Brassica campestris TaxID=3711 RepID=M4DSE7_BRACM
MSRESIDINPANETFTLPSHCYPRFDVATQPQTAIDYHYSDTISRQKNYSFGSWAEESFHESFAVNTELPETRYDEYDEDYHKEKNIECHGLAMGDRGLLHTSSADVTSTSIDSKPTPSIDIDRRPLSSIDGLAAPEQNNYNKAEIDELLNEIYGVIRTPDDFHSKRLDDIYYVFDNSINWLTTCIIQTSIDEGLAPFKDRLQSFTYRLDGVYYPLRDGVDFLTTRPDALQQEMVMIQRQLDFQAEPAPSIDRRTRPSIDDDYTTR